MKRLTFFLGTLLFLCVPLVQWLAPDRTLTNAARMNSLAPEPIKITHLTLKTEEKGKKSSDNANWMNQPLVQVENTSGKPIKYLTLEFSFADADSFKPLILSYGQEPGQKREAGLADVLQPGEKVNLSMRHVCERARSSVVDINTRTPAGSRMRTRINGVIFADGTAWFDGLAHIPDPNNPLRWFVVGESPSSAALDYAPQIKMVKTNFRAHAAAARPWPCYKRLGSEYIECCWGPVASGIFVEDPAGIVQPRVVTSCPPEDPCETLVSQGCGLP